MTTEPSYGERKLLYALDLAVSQVWDGRMLERDLSPDYSRDLQSLILTLKTSVYADHVLKESNVIHHGMEVVVTTPGKRIWWAPWRRRPDVEHKQRVTIPVTITADYFVTFPEIDPAYYPDHLGKPSRVMMYEAGGGWYG